MAKSDLDYEFEVKTLIESKWIESESLEKLSEWIQDSPTLPKLPDKLLALFLIACQGDLEASQHAIIKYISIKKDAPDIFDNRDIEQPELQKAMRTLFIGSIPTRFNDNTAVHYFGIADTRYSNFELLPLMKLAFMILDITQKKNPPKKLIAVMDMKGIGIMHLTRIKLSACKTFLEFLQEGLQVNLCALHILNTNYIFYRALDLVKLFIRSDLLNNIKTHRPGTNMEEFFRDHVPAECMPKEYGGSQPSIVELTKNTHEQFKELKKFFEAEEKLRKSVV